MRAFSLFQLVLVIALVGILAVYVAPGSVLPGVRLSVAANQMVSDIEYARQNALTSGVNSGVQFLSSGTYTAYQGSTSTPLTNAVTRKTIVVNVPSTYPGVSVSNNFTVEYDSNGVPVLGSGGNVIVSNGGSSRTITITANTGKIVLQ